jgi:hypothetical protein
MNLAILFWCHKEPDICEDRIRLIRRYNSSITVFSLYGGSPMQDILFKRHISPHVDDYYQAAPDPPADIARKPGYLVQDYWKKRHADLQIADWYLHRGETLDWDTLLVLPWDTLLFDRAADLFSDLKADQLLLPGLRPISQVETTWDRVRGTRRQEYVAFLEHIGRRYGYRSDPFCFEPTIWCLPKRFLDRYSRIERPTLGFFEYTIPAYAQAFGFSFCTEHALKPRWASWRIRDTFRSDGPDIWVPTIGWHLARRRGDRVFRPYRRKTPGNGRGWARATLTSSWHTARACLRRLVGGENAPRRSVV